MKIKKLKDKCEEEKFKIISFLRKNTFNSQHRAHHVLDGVEKIKRVLDSYSEDESLNLSSEDILNIKSRL